MNGATDPLQIRKYPNRRYYDATRSCHVTLNDVYELINQGHTVCITESTTDEDITNLVLLQMILEREQPKLGVFPSAALHMMIRSEYQVLRSSVERYFAPFMTMFAASQKQFDEYMRQAMQTTGVSPMQWAERMMQAFGPGQAKQAPPRPAPPPEDSPHDSEPQVTEAPAQAESIDELRKQINSLNERLERMSHPG